MDKLSSSLEDYLEAILEIAEKTGVVRAGDIAARLRVRAASVTGALKLLATRKLVHYAPYDQITLTAAGKRVARMIQKKHGALQNFFTSVLGIPDDEAATFACKMEHAIPDHVLERFMAFAEFVNRCPGCAAAWEDKRKGYFCKAYPAGRARTPKSARAG